MKLTKQQWDKLRYRYCQHTGSIQEDDMMFIEPSKTKSKGLKSDTWYLISSWLDECVKRTENNKETK
jgi:hypothetical protein